MTVESNVPLQEGYSQVCVWPATIVGTSTRARRGFVRSMFRMFGIRVQYLEEIDTHPDKTGPGGRTDLFFAIHNEDVGKFGVNRLGCGIHWIEDVFKNQQGHLYPERVAKYQSW